MPADSHTQQYIVLPPRGMVATDMTASHATQTYLVSLQSAMGRGGPRRVRKTVAPLRVLDSIHGNGAKLVEMSPQFASDLRAEQPGIRIVPVVYYYPQIYMPPFPAQPPRVATATVGAKIVIPIQWSSNQRRNGGGLYRFHQSNRGSRHDE